MKSLICIFIFQFIFQTTGTLSYGAFDKEQETNDISHYAEQRKILADLYTINLNLKKNLKKKSDLIEKLSIARDKLSRIEENIANVEMQTSSLKTEIAKRLNFTQKFKGDEFISLILRPNNYFSKLRGIKILQTLNKQDIQQIKELNSLLKQLDQEKKMKIKTVQMQENLMKEIDNEVQLYTNDQESKRLILAKAKKDQIINLKDRAEISRLMKKNSIDDESILDLFEKHVFIDNRGLLDWPVAGQPIRNFLSAQDSQEKFTIDRQQVFFETQFREEVRAIFYAKVIWVGELPHLGKTLILDHGDHFYSVYGNLNEFLTKPGDRVLSKQVIARAGTNQFSAFTGIEFQLRHYVELTDPAIWMKGKKL